MLPTASIRGPESGDQPVGHEVRRRLHGQRAREGQHHDSVDAERQGVAHAVVDSHELAGRSPGSEHDQRVRVEGDQYGGEVQSLCMSDCPTDKRLEAAVETVEDAHRDDGSGREGAGRRPAQEDMVVSEHIGSECGCGHGVLQELQDPVADNGEAPATGKVGQASGWGSSSKS